MPFLILEGQCRTEGDQGRALLGSGGSEKFGQGKYEGQLFGSPELGLSWETLAPTRGADLLTPLWGGADWYNLANGIPLVRLHLDCRLRT